MKRFLCLCLPLALLCGGRLGTQAQTNLIVDDTFADGTRTNWNLPLQAPWFFSSSTATYVTVEPGTLTLINYPPSGLTKYFWSYFTSNAPDLSVPTVGGITNPISNTTNSIFGRPVELAVGQMLRATLRFIPTGEMYADGSSGVRFALLSYNHADQGRVARDTVNFSKSGTNVSGYRLQIPLYNNFTNNNIISLHVRSNLSGTADSTDPMGKANDWYSLGASPSLTNVAGFIDGSEYTVQLSVARYAASNIISGSVAGPLAGVSWTNYTRSTVDVLSSNYFKFDCFAIRVDSGSQLADQFLVKEFKVETWPFLPLVAFQVAGAQLGAPQRYVLSWESVPGHTYQVQSKSDIGAAHWSTNYSVLTSQTSCSWTNEAPAAAGFYRVLAQ